MQIFTLNSDLHSYISPDQYICTYFQTTMKPSKVLLENGWNSKRMITEGDAAIPLETTRRAFGNQEKSKQRSVIIANPHN